MYNKDEVFEERKQAAMKANSDTVDVSDLAENISKIDPWTERQNESVERKYTKNIVCLFEFTTTRKFFCYKSDSMLNLKGSLSVYNKVPL